MIVNSWKIRAAAKILRLCTPGSNTFKEISTLHNVDVPGMDSIFRNENTS